MSIGVLTMTTPLAERIDRWATSGKATRILLHPEDFIKVNVDKLTQKYNLPVEPLGGARGLQDYLNRNVKDPDDVDTGVKATQLASIEQNLNDVFQSEE